MGYKARWGPMGFLVSPSKVVPFDSFATSINLKTDSGNDTSGTGTANTRGLELQSMSFSTKYMRALCVDPRDRVETWTNLVGQSHPLYIGNKRFGPAKMLLTGVSLSDLITNNEGDFLSVVLNITLQEDRSATTTTASTGATSGRSAASTSQTAEASAKTNETLEQAAAKKKAMNATASAADKADKKSTQTLSGNKANNSLSGLM